jgi:two-component system alkaline phosphatase synthesis response regulator PhoP
MNSILQRIQNSEKTYYTKGEIIQLIESTMPKKPTQVEVNGITVDLQTYTINASGHEIRMPKKVLDLTYYLIANAGRIVRRDEILDEIWGSEVIVGERTIDVHIAAIRKVFPKGSIKTVKGVGYQWN